MPTMSAMAIAGVAASSIATNAAMIAVIGLLLFLNLPKFVFLPTWWVGI